MSQFKIVKKIRAKLFQKYLVFTCGHIGCQNATQDACDVDMGGLANCSITDQNAVIESCGYVSPQKCRVYRNVWCDVIAPGG